MKKSISKTICIALLAIGIALFSFSACTDANAQTGRSAQPERWEYKLELLDLGNRPRATDELNNLASEGWQVVTVGGGSGNIFVLRRRLP